MVPLTILKLSLTTLAMGARQFVVQDAFEIMLCLAGIVLVFVHAQHQSDVFVLRRGRNDDFLDRPTQVFFGIVGIGEMAGGLDHDLGAD